MMNHCMPIKSNEGNGCISGKVCNSKIDLGKKRFVWTYNLQPIGSAYFTNETKLTRKRQFLTYGNIFRKQNKRENFLTNLIDYLRFYS